MLKRLLCLALSIVLSVSAWAEDIKTVMSYYQPEMSKGFIYVSKADMTLTLVDSLGQVIVTYPIACGRNYGPKSAIGDYKTPEGYFLLQMVQDASKWGHNFHDGKGYIQHAYGPYFMRLKTGFSGIGIHGTHAPESIGTRATEGCIRLENGNVADLREKVNVGMPVIIGAEAGVDSLIACNVPSPKHLSWNGKDNSRPSLKKEMQPVESLQPQTPAEEGTIDIDPERDLVDPEIPVEVPSVKVEDPVEDPAAPVEESVITVEEPVAPVEEPVSPVEETVVSVEEPAVTVEEPATLVKESAVTVEEPIETVEETTAPVEVPVAPVEEPVSTEMAPGKRAKSPHFVNNQDKEETKLEEKPAENPIQITEPDKKAEPVKDDSKTTESTTSETKYEVVVEKVEGPDGETKYQVRYVRVKK